MAVTLKEKGAYRVATLFAISGTAPTAWTWNITEDGKIVGGYEPAIFFAGDAIADNGGMIRSEFTVREKGPHFTLEGSTVKKFTSLSALLAYHHVEGASVTITRRFYNSAAASEDVSVLSGKIVQVLDSDAGTSTFAVEMRSELAQNRIPRVIVTPGANEGLYDDGIPNSAIGLSVPVPFGRFARYLGKHFAGEDATSWRYSYALHFRPNVIPAVEVYRTSNSSRFAFADYLRSGGLRLGDPSDTLYVGKQAAFIYIPEDDTYAWVRDDGTNIAWDLYSLPWNLACYTINFVGKPWVTVPFRPPKIESYSGALNPEKCINGEPFDYAEISSGGAIYLEFPQPKYRGRISQNSKDGGSPGTYAGGDGSEAPCGISIRVALAAPVGIGTISSATLNVEAVFPGDDTALFGLTAASIEQPTTPGTGRVGQHDLPYRNQSDGTFNGADDGWGGTKFHLYDFTSCPSASAGDADFPLYSSSGSANMTMPFRIKLSVPASPAGRKVYVADVCLTVGAKHQVEANQPGLSKYKVTDKVWKGALGESRSRKRNEWTIDYYGDPDGEPRMLSQKRHAWDRGIGSRQRVQRERPSLANVYVSSCGYADDGTYVGTSGRPLVNSADQGRYLVRGYGKETSFVTAGSSFGSWVEARNVLNKWTELQAVGMKWESDFLQAAESKANPALLDLTSQAPGLFACKSRIGAWLAHVWYPDPATTLVYAQYGEVNPLHCLSGSDGVAIAFSMSDAADVVNDLTINYGWDPGRGKFLYSATCTASDYNDGQGNNWPFLFGVDAAAICSWSQGPSGSRYGYRHREVDLHGVRDGRLATVLGASILARNYRRVPVLEMTMDAAYSDMQFGHLFTLNHNAMTSLGFAAPAWAGATFWSSIWWRCTHVETHDLGGGAVETLIRAEWMPTTIGGEVSGFAPGEEEGVM